MLVKIGLAVLILIIAVLAYAATRPDSFRVQRSIAIHASQEKIFPLINDLHSWDKWSDHKSQKTFGGPAAGTGATAEWHGSGQEGTAKMTIVESIPEQKVAVMVAWQKPFEAHNLNEYTLQPHGAETEVTLSIQGSNRYPMKVIGVFMDIPKEFGKHMDATLQGLKLVAEKQ